MSINIKQLPGLKESNSTGMLKIPGHISHSKNRSSDMSSSKIRGNSQLRKVIDANGNVRYKLLNQPKVIKMDQNRSIHKINRSALGNLNSYSIRNSSYQVKNT